MTDVMTREQLDALEAAANGFKSDQGDAEVCGAPADHFLFAAEAAGAAAQGDPPKRMVTAYHRRITPTCVANKGRAVAAAEAASGVYDAAEKAARGYGDRGIVHVKVEIEVLPKANEQASAAEGDAE